ncbi:MAG: hypothetical protein AAFW00_18105 [Bacteroidota bacterium]
MDILERIIENLTSDEVRRFKILSNRFKADEEKKLLILFDAIRAGDFKTTEPVVIASLYGSTDSKAKNSYYRLRNKLLQNLEKSLLFYHFNYKNSIEALSNIQLSMLFRERGLYREAFYQLKKAEKVGLDQDQFNVLEVVYAEMVKLATHHEIDIESIIHRRRENQKKIEILRANSEVLGTITQELSRRNYARSKRSSSVIDTLEQIKAQLEEHAQIFRSASGKIMIMNTVAPILIQKGAYRELADYAQATLDDFESGNLFSEDNHTTRLRLRIFRINSLLKLLRLEQALKELEIFCEELDMYHRQNFNEFAFHFYANKVFALKLARRLDEAQGVLDEAFLQKEILKNGTPEVFLLISQADQHFSKEDYAKAILTLNRLLKHSHFSKLDAEIRLYVQIFRVVNFYEAGQHTQVADTAKSIRRSFRNLLKDEFYEKTTKFLEIVLRMNTAAVEGKKVFLKAALRNFTEAYPPSEIGDNQIILYELYLQSKLNPEYSYYQLLCNKALQAVS